MGMVAIQRVAPRRVVLVTAVIAAVIMGDSMIYNVLPANVSSFGVSVGLVGVLLSADRFVRLASNPPAAWVIQRFGTPGPVYLGSAIFMLAALGFFILGFLHSPIKRTSP